jgi:hypothetical protein
VAGCGSPECEEFRCREMGDKHAKNWKGAKRVRRSPETEASGDGRSDKDEWKRRNVNRRSRWGRISRRRRSECGEIDFRELEEKFEVNCSEGGGR